MSSGAQRWAIESTEEFDDWIERLAEEDQDHIVAALRVLERSGPGLGRPLVDSIKGSKHHNMKEIRVGALRILFIFDPDRNAILLLGGDKTNRWEAWYVENIPRADTLYDRYLEERRQRQVEEPTRQPQPIRRAPRRRGKRS